MSEADFRAWKNIPFELYRDVSRIWHIVAIAASRWVDTREERREQRQRRALFYVKVLMPQGQHATTTSSSRSDVMACTGAINALFGCAEWILSTIM